MNSKVRWGILGAASIALRRTLPGMAKCEWSEVTAIASRDLEKAKAAASRFEIPKAYGSYDQLLADPEIEAVYIPLPNHLHVPWTTKAAEAGKHVLCEKPLGTSAADASALLDVRARTGVKIGEAFMVRTHPRWLRIRELVRAGRIGQLRSISGLFSFFTRDLGNVRNSLAYGGGALLDIGCYPVTLSRFLFGEEPARVLGLIERDPEMKTDRLVSAILDFPSGRCTFTCSTQLTYYQRMQLLGTRGRIEVESPLNSPVDKSSRILIEDGPDSAGAPPSEEVIPACDQFAIQADLFSKAVRGEGEVAVPLEDSLRNLAAIDAIFRSAQSDHWEVPTLAK